MRDYLQFLREQPRFLAFGLLLTFSSGFGQTYFISLFKPYFLELCALSNTQYGLIYSGATLASAVTLLWLGRRIDTVDLRVFSVVVCIGYVLACLLLSSVTQVAGLVLALYALRLSGQGLMGHTASTSVTRYLAGARGKAMGIISLGYPMSEATFPLLAGLLLASVGWRNTWQAIACALALLLVPAVLVLLKGHGERHEEHLQEASRLPEEGSEAQRHWTAREVLRDRRFYLLLPSVLAPAFIATGIFFNGTDIAAAKGWSLTLYQSSFILYAAATVVGSLVGGQLADRMALKPLVCTYLIPHSLALLVLAGGQHPLVLGAYMLGAGLSAGASGSIYGALWPGLYGARNLGAVRTLMMAAMVFATSLSPVLMGALTDAGVSTETIAVSFCLYTAVAPAFSFLALRK